MNKKEILELEKESIRYLERELDLEKEQPKESGLFALKIYIFVVASLMLWLIFT